MPTFDAHRNFAIGSVATPPAPATTGTSLILNPGQGASMPAPPFNLTVWPVGNAPDANNAEIVRVTAITADTLTIVRAQEGSNARTIIASDAVMAGITVRTVTDVEKAVAIGGSGSVAFVGSANANTTPAVTITHNRGQTGYAVALAVTALPAFVVALAVLNKTASSFQVQAIATANVNTNVTVTFDWVLTGP
jgi:hypothetical protein